MRNQIQIAQVQAELAGNRRTGERLERAKQDLEEQLNQSYCYLLIIEYRKYY